MRRLTGALFLAGAFILAGTSVIAARFVAARLGTFTIAAGSLFFALLGLLPLCGPRLGRTLSRMTASDWLMLALQAGCGIFLFRMFLLKGLLLTSTGEAGILTGVTPAATALLAWLVLKERLYKTRLSGLASTVAGILLIQGASWPGTGFFKGHFAGNLLVICAALCESIFNVLSRISSARAGSGDAYSRTPGSTHGDAHGRMPGRLHGGVHNHTQELDPIMQTTLVAGIALLLCLLPALTESPVASLMSLDAAGWLALAWYGLFVTALAFIFWYAGISRCEASVAAACSGMMPFTALLLAVLLLGEQPGWPQWLGGLLVVIGMLLTGLPHPEPKERRIAIT